VANPQEKITKIVDAENTNYEASVNIRGSKGAQVVEIVDGSGNQITSFGTSAGTDINGTKVSVGTTEIEVTFTGTPQSIFIQADHDNTGSIYIGKIGVTSSDAMARLMAGESITIDLDDTSNAVYVIASAVSQNIYKMALT
jgi:hypothetical protein